MTPQELKNSILQLAIQGKLVEQRPEEGTAEELYRQIQQEKQRLIKEGKLKKEKPLPEITEEEKPFDIPEGWKWVRLIDLCSLISDGTHKTPAYVESGVPFLSVKDISSGKMDFSHTRFISLDEHKQLIARCKPEKNDILICRIGTLGKALQIDTNREFSIFVSLGLVKIIDPQISQYIVTSINSGYGYSWIQKVKVGGGTHTFKINLDDLRLFPIPLPPIKEQNRIHAKIEELLPLIDRYEKAWSRLEEFNKRFPDDMQKSILQMAIQGKLVEQRPEEGTGEELYQKIQAEKQKLIKEGKIKKEKPLPEITEDEKPFDIPESWKWVQIGKIFNLQAGKNINGSEISEIMSQQKPYQCFGGNGCRGFVGSYNRSGHYAIIGRQGALCGNINYANGLFYATEHAVVVEQFAGTDVLWCGYFLTALNLNQYATATAQPGLAVANINQVLFPLPPLAEQKRIVAKIEELLPLCESLKQN